jgi:hypothetical protein
MKIIDYIQQETLSILAVNHIDALQAQVVEVEN